MSVTLNEAERQRLEQLLAQDEDVRYSKCSFYTSDHNDHNIPELFMGGSECTEQCLQTHRCSPECTQTH